MLARHMSRTALLLAAFTLGGTFILAATFNATHDSIEANKREALLKSLHTLVPPELHDNDPVTDTITVVSSELLGTADPVTVYRARKQGQPVAVILSPVAPDGYSGKIKLLVAIRADGVVMGVRVVSHKETPGLGDPIEIEKSNWIKSFDNKSLDNPAPAQWKVKKDGGIFDQFTGATITPRAVVKAVKKSLEYYMQHRDELFAATPGGGPQP